MNEDTKQQEQKGNGVLPCVIGRFFKEMAEKHKVNIEALNLHIDGKTLYVQKYEYGAYPEFTRLETFDLNDL
jgi:protein tyrosine phosphatase